MKKRKKIAVKIVKIKRVGIPLKEMKWLIDWMMMRGLETSLEKKEVEASVYYECAKALSAVFKLHRGGV